MLLRRATRVQRGVEEEVDVDVGFMDWFGV